MKIRLNLQFMHFLNIDTDVMTDDFAEAMHVYYNYLRLHQALTGLTSAQMAKIPINLDSNRWLMMIELANIQK